MNWMEKLTPEDLEHIKWFREFLDKQYENWLRIVVRDKLNVYEVRLDFLARNIDIIRQELRKEGNFEVADKLRDALKASHIIVEDR